MFEFYPQNPHDHFVRRTFDVTAHARVLLKSRLSPGVLAELNLDTLTATKETFLGADEHENRLDLLYSVQQRSGEELLIYLLLEHKSGVDRWIALQLLRYVVNIFRLLRSWQEIDAQMDAVNDIIIYLYAVFDARKLEWFEQAIRTGLQSESEKQMPTCLEAMIERGIEQGIEKGIDQGIETGLIVGRIRTLQEVLRQPITAEAELLALPVAELQQRAIRLQALLPQS